MDDAYDSICTLVEQLLEEGHSREEIQEAAQELKELYEKLENTDGSKERLGK